MRHAVVMGDPRFFRIRYGQNPYTRNAWGFRKKVKRGKAIAQWQTLKDTLEALGAKVFVIPPQKSYPGMAFPANAGFLFPKYEMRAWQEKTFYLSNLVGKRSPENLVYHHFFASHGFDVRTLPYAFEGEADFFPCGDSYIFSYGAILPMGFKPRWAMPPWRYQFSHRSDERNRAALAEIMGKKNIIEVRLRDPWFYHGDTAMFAFGRKREYLLAYLEALDRESQERLEKRLSARLVPLSGEDARRFAANSFQLETVDGPRLIMPQGTSQALKEKISGLGFRIAEVDVSEFFEKGGGSVKCLLLDLGPYPGTP